MAKIIPFKGVRPIRKKVHLVSSRPIYTYKKSHLKAKLESNPYSFLHVINPEFNIVKKNKSDSIQRFELIKKKYEYFKNKKYFIKEEKPVIEFAYSSVVSISEIKKGDQFSLDNIWIKRPGTGPLFASDFEEIIGKKASRHISTDKPFYKPNENVFIETWVVDAMNKTPRFQEK
mgnify:CR=1 FL=1